MNSLVIENSDASSLFDSGTEGDSYMQREKSQNEISAVGLPINQRNLTPNILGSNISMSQLSKGSDIYPSDISNGSYVGTNQVFIPSLNIQEDVINKEILLKQQNEKAIKEQREKDKGKARFQMKKAEKGKGKKNLLKAKNDKLIGNIGLNKTPSPALVSDNSSKEFAIGVEKTDSKANPFNPLVLNLSKVQNKGNMDKAKVKDNSFFDKTNEEEKWDIQAIRNTEEDQPKNMTVTLGTNSNIANNFIPPKISNSKNTGLLDFETAEMFEHTGIHSDLYQQERSFRGIYHDEELHALIIYLIFSLILTPQRGTLDDLYCSRHPLQEGKPPVLHFLHFHLNHPSNQTLIPMVLKKVEKQFSENSGVRLLKLLCKTLFDRNLYQDSTLIAKGGYGTVYQCNTR